MRGDALPGPAAHTAELRRDEGRLLLAGVVAGGRNRFLPHTDLTLLRVSALLRLLTGVALGYVCGRWPQQSKGE